MTLHEFYIGDTTFSFKVDVYVNRTKVNHINKVSIVIKTQQVPTAVIEHDEFKDEKTGRGKKTKVLIIPLTKWGFTYDTETGRYSINFDEVRESSITEYYLEDKRPKDDKYEHE